MKLTAIMLEGHVNGQIGLLLQDTKRGPVFFVADACWTTKAVDDRDLPHPLSMVIQNDQQKYYNTIRTIQKIKLQIPGLTIIPTHCRQTSDV